jgi:peptidoglycan/LPS O-acetylase OafA/YrhL
MPASLSGSPGAAALSVTVHALLPLGLRLTFQDPSVPIVWNHVVAALEQPPAVANPPPKSPRLLDRLSRITTPGRNFIPQIDGLRFIAIMAVIAFHILRMVLFHFGLNPGSGPETGGLVGRVFAAGHNGVPLFFAISGFILSLPFARAALDGRQVRLKEYYLRRVTRIEPPYLIHLFFLLVLCALVYRRLPSHPHLYHNPEWLRFTLSHILPSLLYANGFVYATHPYPNLVLWSLEVEVQFYLLAPFFAKLFLIQDLRKRRTLLIFLILLGCLSGLFGEHYRIWASLAGNLQCFLVGFLLTELYVTKQLLPPATRPKSAGYLWDVAFMLACAAVVWGETRPIMMFLLPAAIFVSGLSAFRGAWCPRLLGCPWVATIGGMCYTIYLYHPVLLSVLIRVTGKLRTGWVYVDLLAQFAVMSAATIVICAFLFVFLERPFMRRDWPRRVYDFARGWRHAFKVKSAKAPAGPPVASIRH